MSEQKKMHWLSTPEGKKKMSEIQKRVWAKKRKTPPTSKAAKLIKKMVGKKAADTNRNAIYERAAETAVSTMEVGKLMDILGMALLRDLMGGAK